MAGRVEVVEAFPEAVDEDTWVWGLDVDVGVGQVGPVEGDKGGVGLLADALLGERGVTANAAPGSGLDIDLAEESARALGDTEQEERSGGGDGDVDAVFD